MVLSPFTKSSVALLLLFTTAVLASGTDQGYRFTHFAGFTLGEGTLADVQRNLGRAQVVKTGEAGEFVASICYKVADGFAEFMAGELGGGVDLLGFTISNQPDRGPCVSWQSSRSLPRSEISKIRLGMNREDVQRVVGVPLKNEANHASVAFESKRPMTATEKFRLPQDVQAGIRAGEIQDFFDVVITLDFDFSRGRLTKFTVWKTETT